MSQDLTYIPYNRSNKDYARANRKNQTPAEYKIREEVLRRKQTGYTRLRQKMIGSFIVDFYCSKLLLAIEIDGDSHKGKELYDTQRSSFLNDQGITVLRYTNREVMNSIETVRANIHSFTNPNSFF